MNCFETKAQLKNIHQHFPPVKHRPTIGITTNFIDGDAALRKVYYDQVVQAGGVPMLIPPVADAEVIVNTLEKVDAILLTGGADLNPLWLGHEPQKALGNINAERDLPELLLIELAFNRQLPMLGICRGMQMMAAALGGDVLQDMGNDPALLKHSQQAPKTEATHSVNIAADTVLASIYGAGKRFVNSFHHQAVATTGPRFKASAWAPDNTIEAMESSEHKALLAVQWHPEWLGEEGLPLFKWLVGQAQNFNAAKRLHERVLTFDSHCDTPMFFAQGVDFAQRAETPLVDLHKMTEGRQDAVTMVAYLPQPKFGETFSNTVKLSAYMLKEHPELEKTVNPAQYANLIFDEIEQMVKANATVLSIARTPADLYNDKRNGRKSIMLGIENGLALDHDLANVRHFAQRGVTYITLCHNGDNDICDSHRGANMHNGVSAFGEKVILEMNKNGVMVDLSHAGEKSFYDAIGISQTPIVCSHSSCRALCDHTRNLTDDQLRALAAQGGVAQITVYDGFLRRGGGASIMDVMAHLEHAIAIMGVDHVGLGTDFDGDGGVCGLANSSELLQFTLQLLRRKYSETDIRKIWGGNWLRVMAQVQAHKM